MDANDWLVISFKKGFAIMKIKGIQIKTNPCEYNWILILNQNHYPGFSEGRGFVSVKEDQFILTTEGKLITWLNKRVAAVVEKLIHNEMKKELVAPFKKKLSYQLFPNLTFQ